MGQRLWILALLGCSAVWGSTFYLVKEAIAGVHPVALVGHRFLLSAALIAPWLALRKGRPGWTRPMLRDAGTLGALLLALYVSQTLGLAWTTASNSGFITGLFVLFVPLLIYFFRRRPPTRSQWAAVALAVAGLWVLTGGVKEMNRGDAITLISALTYAGHLLLTDRLMREGGDAGWLAFHQFWMTGLTALALAAVFGASAAPPTGRAGAVILFLALIPTIAAFFVQMEGQKHVDALRVSLVFSTEPVFAALFAWTLGGEQFKLQAAAGGGLIVAAMAVSDLSAEAALPPTREVPA